MRAVNERLGIRTESWSPLGKRQAPFAEPAVAAAAEAHGVTPGPGDPALARAARLGADPEVGDPRAAARRTSTSSASSSPTTRSPRSPASAAPDGRLFGGDPDTPRGAVMPRDAVPAGRPRPAAPQHRPGGRVRGRWGSGPAAAREDAQDRRDRAAAAGGRRGGHLGGHHRRGRDLRPHGIGDVFVAYPLWLDDVAAGRLPDLTGDAPVAIGVDSVEGAANAGRLLGARRRGPRRGRLRPPPQRGPPPRRREGGPGRGPHRPAVRGVFTFPGHSYAAGALASAAADEAAALREAAGPCARQVSSRAWSAGARPRASRTPTPTC